MPTADVRSEDRQSHPDKDVNQDRRRHNFGVYLLSAPQDWGHKTEEGNRFCHWVWIIVGDIPPAYFGLEDAPNFARALECYIGCMESWVEAVQEGRDVSELIPVNTPATSGNAKCLAWRLEFLDREILSSYPDDLARTDD